MRIKVLNVAEYSSNNCNFMEYTPIIIFEFTTKSELDNGNIYDLVAKNLVAKNFAKSFNLYSVDLEYNNIELIPKSVGFRTYNLMSEKAFKSYEAIVILGEFIAENTDTVTELFKKNGGNVCDCVLGGYTGSIEFDRAESDRAATAAAAGDGGGAAAAELSEASFRGGSAKGGRKVRSRRRVIKKRRNITKKRIRRRNRK
jgi:hypothetical protein